MTSTLQLRFQVSFLPHRASKYFRDENPLKKNHPFFAKVLRSESQHIIKGLGGTEEGANDMCVSSGSSRRCMRIGEGDEGGEGSVVQRCHAIDLLCTQTKRDELALGW